MSYCVFRNALSDLHDINRALNDLGGNFDSLSPEEREAVIKVINLMRKIGDDWGEQ